MEDIVIYTAGSINTMEIYYNHHFLHSSHPDIQNVTPLVARLQEHSLQVIWIKISVHTIAEFTTIIKLSAAVA